MLQRDDFASHSQFEVPFDCEIIEFRIAAAVLAYLFGSRKVLLIYERPFSKYCPSPPGSVVL